MDETNNNTKQDLPARTLAILCLNPYPSALDFLYISNLIMAPSMNVAREVGASVSFLMMAPGTKSSSSGVARRITGPFLDPKVLGVKNEYMFFTGNTALFCKVKANERGELYRVAATPSKMICRPTGDFEIIIVLLCRRCEYLVNKIRNTF